MRRPLALISPFISADIFCARPQREEVAAEAFNEVLEAKKAVFDKWQVDSFDEVRALASYLSDLWSAADHSDLSPPLQPAYVLEAADLTGWVDQGLWEKPPKKTDGKKEPSPPDESTKDCDGTC